MIEFIEGPVESLNPACAVLRAGGLGYMVNITLTTFEAMRGQQSTRLLIHEVVREDGTTLYGFSTEAERAMFRALVGVSGVGAATARIILSSIPASDLQVLIASGDDARLKAVKGIGTKTAQRIIVDLKDKIKPLAGTLNQQASGTTGAASASAYDEALTALVILGFAKAQVQKVLDAVFRADPTLSVEGAIKQALSRL